MRISRALVACTIAVAGLPAGAHGQAAEPFSTRNLNAPLAVFVLPDWSPVPERATFAASLELANHYRASRSESDVLLLDGETTRLNLRYERPVGERWSVAAAAPFIRQDGGVLDDLVDGWHSVFRLPDGGRNGRPEDLIEFRIRSPGGPPFDLTTSDAALGDVVLSAARSMGAARGITVRGSLKLATGRESLLAGSGASDWMLTVLRTRPVALRQRAAGYFWGFGVVGLGEAKVLPYRQEDTVITGLAGGGIAIGPRFGARAQVEVHTPFYDTPLKELGRTGVQVAFGGWWTVLQGRLDFAIGEDLQVSTAPDVLVHAQMTWSFGGRRQ